MLSGGCMTLAKQSRGGAGERRGARAVTEPPPTGPALPPWKAFVVQLTHDTTPHSLTFAGRVEHLGSGRRERFRSRKELPTILLQLLKEVAQEER